MLEQTATLLSRMHESPWILKDSLIAQLLSEHTVCDCKCTVITINMCFEVHVF